MPMTYFRIEMILGASSSSDGGGNSRITDTMNMTNKQAITGGNHYYTKPIDCGRD
jgi:hypothetical protein